MGGKYFINAKNYDDFAWQFDLYTDNCIKFAIACIKCFMKYEMIDMGVRK